MESSKLELLFKLLWIGLVLFTIYMFCWQTFVYFTFANVSMEKYGVLNLLVPNMLTIGLLILYSKEILIGYRQKSISRNSKSLLVFSVLITILTFLQIPQLELLFNNLKSEYWQIILSLIMVLTSYVGIILNRVLKIKELKKK